MAGSDGIEVEMWVVEDIPSSDLLFLRIKHCHVDRGEPLPAAFRNHGSGDDLGMSTDWERYSTAEETRNRATEPTLYGVISMRVGDARDVPGQTVVHSPIWPENRAHTNVVGPKSRKEARDVGLSSVEIRLRFAQISEWRIPVIEDGD